MIHSADDLGANQFSFPWDGFDQWYWRRSIGGCEKSEQKKNIPMIEVVINLRKCGKYVYICM